MDVYQAPETQTRQGFVCYARADRKLVATLRDRLDVRLAVNRHLDLGLWQDLQILPGRPWEAAILKAIAESDFGLLMVTPDFLSRVYIADVELPALFAQLGPRVIPVGVRRVDFELNDLRGLDARQFFIYNQVATGQERWYTELGGENREKFCDGLAARVHDIVTEVE